MLKISNARDFKVFVIGTVCFKINIGSTLVLANVKNGPDIPLNLISVRHLDDDSYHNDLFNG